MEDQAIDRAHRIGQTRPVHVSRITVKGGSDIHGGKKASAISEKCALVRNVGASSI